MESRIHREVYVRFGGEYLETYYGDITRRWVLSLLGRYQQCPDSRKRPGDRRKNQSGYPGRVGNHRFHRGFLEQDLCQVWFGLSETQCHHRHYPR